MLVRSEQGAPPGIIDPPTRAGWGDGERESTLHHIISHVTSLHPQLSSRTALERSYPLIFKEWGGLRAAFHQGQAEESASRKPKMNQGHTEYVDLLFTWRVVFFYLTRNIHLNEDAMRSSIKKIIKNTQKPS